MARGSDPFPHARPYADCHGKRRWRYRKKGFTAELGTKWGSESFRLRYEAAVAGKKARGRIGAGRTIPQSFSALVASYYGSPEWLALAESTRATYRGVIEPMREAHPDALVRDMRRRHVKTLIAEKAGLPGAANNRLKRLRQLLDHALDLEWITVNPAAGVKLVPVEEGGFHTWDEGEIARFLDTHAPGTMSHRVMTLMLYTGASRKDACALGWGNVRGDRIVYRRGKTRKRTGVVVNLPILPVLGELLATLPRDAFTFLQTHYGRARSPESVTGDMRRWCDAAGLPARTSHGLRKAIARRLAEAGATGPEIVAVTGHKSMAEADPYLEAANRGLMANAGMERVGEAQNVTNHPERFVNQTRKPLT